jgi:protein involved in polysaccharide export with SLBB domain
VVGLLALAACTSSPDKRVLQYLNTDGFGKRYVGNVLHDDYLTVGDEVAFQDTYNTGLSGRERIGMDGTIDFDQAGRVWVAGMTREEAEVYLTEKAAAYYTQADVKVVLATNPKQFFIFGEVGATGPQKLLGDLTLFEVVMAAGPLENSANLGRVRLIRPDPVDPLVITANIGQMLQGGDSTFNPLIQDNDIIVVPPTMLAQIGYFISDLVFPFTTVFSTVFKGLLSINNFGNKLGGKNKNTGVF